LIVVAAAAPAEEGVEEAAWAGGAVGLTGTGLLLVVEVDGAAVEAPALLAVAAAAEPVATDF
jgi:hypothetical protein